MKKYEIYHESLLFAISNDSSNLTSIYNLKQSNSPLSRLSKFKCLNSKYSYGKKKYKEVK